MPGQFDLEISFSIAIDVALDDRLAGTFKLEVQLARRFREGIGADKRELLVKSFRRTRVDGAQIDLVQLRMREIADLVARRDGLSSFGAGIEIEGVGAKATFVVNKEGKEVPPNVGGLLVIRQPWPSMLRGAGRHARNCGSL